MNPIVLPYADDVPPIALSLPASSITMPVILPRLPPTAPVPINELTTALELAVEPEIEIPAPVFPEMRVGNWIV